MTEEATSTIQEDIAKGLYDIAVCHQEEVSRLMQEFDKHENDTIVQLEAYEAERQSQTPGLSTPEQVAPSRPSTEHTHQSAESDDDDDTQNHEPSLFDILHDDAEDDSKEDFPSDHQA